MDRNNEFYNPNSNLSNFNNVDTQNLNFALNSNDDLTQLGKLKNELRENLEFLENKLKNEPSTEQDWQVVINYKNNTKIKLNSVNSQVTRMLKQYSSGGNGVKYVQVQRFGGIFDQLTSEFNHVGKQLDSKYQRFMLFSSPNNYYTEGEGSNKVFTPGKVLVGAIKDVESLADQANLNLEMLKKDNEIRWCLDTGLLPNTRYTLEGNTRNNIYSKSQTKEIFSQLLNQLFESESFINNLYEKMEHRLPIDVVKNQTQSESNINYSLSHDLQSLGVFDISGMEFLNSFLTDIMSIIDNKDYDLKDILDEKLENRLLTAKEFMPLKVFKTLIKRIILNGIKNAENTRNLNMNVNGEWDDSVMIDGELVNMLNYGTASGILNRIRFVMTSENRYNTVKDVRNSRGYYKVKATLMFQLPRLSVSRQIVFSRVLNYLSKLINIDSENLYSYLVVRHENNLNGLMWNLIYKSITDSGIRELYYDENNFLKELHKMKNRGYHVSRIFKVLVYQEESYVGDEEDFENIKSDVEAQEYLDKYDLDYDLPNFAKLIFQTKGVGPFESGVFEV